jgi:hypothetical protein
MKQPKREDAAGKEACQVCRVTYSVFSIMPAMPAAMALNVETGEFFLMDTLHAYSTGHDIAEALGYAWACDCHERNAEQRFDEQFMLKDHSGEGLAGVRYRVRAGSSVIAGGVTDSQGRTQRILTRDSRRLTLEIHGQV